MPNAEYQLIRHDGVILPIPALGATIGRHRSNEIIVADEEVSRQHARILLAAGRCWVRDENSAQGVFVNGQSVPGQQELRLGDILQVGNTNFRLEVGQATNQPGISSSAQKQKLTLIGTAFLILSLGIMFMSSGGRTRSSGGGEDVLIPTSTLTLTPTITLTPTPDAPSAQLNKTYRADDAVWGLAWSADDQFLMIQKYSKDFTIWAVEYDSFWPPINDRGMLIYKPFSGTWSPDGQYFVVRNRWDFYIMNAMGSETYYTYESGIFIGDMIWSPDSAFLVVSLSDDSIIIVNTNNYKVDQTITEFEDVNYISLSPDGSKLAIQGNNALNIWDIDADELIGVYETLLSPVWSPDGQFIAGHFWHSLKVINLQSNEIRSYPSPDYHGIGNLHLDWSPNGRYISSAHKDGTVRLWFANNPDEFLVLSEPESPVVTLSFSTDGKYLAAGEDSGNVIIWEID